MFIIRIDSGARARPPGSLSLTHLHNQHLQLITAEHAESIQTRPSEAPPAGSFSLLSLHFTFRSFIFHFLLFLFFLFLAICSIFLLLVFSCLVFFFLLFRFFPCYMLFPPLLFLCFFLFLFFSLSY